MSSVPRKDSHPEKDNNIQFESDSLLACVDKSLESLNVEASKIATIRDKLAKLINDNPKRPLIEITNAILEEYTGQNISELYPAEYSKEYLKDDLCAKVKMREKLLAQDARILLVKVRLDIQYSLLDPAKNERLYQIDEIPYDKEFKLVHAMQPETLGKKHDKFMTYSEEYGYARRSEFGHLVLNQPCEEFTESELKDPEVLKKLSHIMDTVVPFFLKEGGGLAMTQLGLGLRMFAMNCPPGKVGGPSKEELAYYKDMISKGKNPNNRTLDYFLEESKHEMYTDGIIYAINPKIVSKSGLCG